MKTLARTFAKIAVATGFPAGQTPLTARLEEIKFAVSSGASEIDIVINRQFALSGNWKGNPLSIGCRLQACFFTD